MKFESLIKPSRLWRSRISWRITLTVFVTIIIVQTGILYFALPNKEQEYLQRLEDIGQAAIVPVVKESSKSVLEPAIAEHHAERLTTRTIIEGFAVYDIEGNLISTHGEPTTLMLSSNSLMESGTFAKKDSKLSPSGEWYEVHYPPAEIRRPFHVVARMTSTNIQPQIAAYVKETVIILFLMSGFVTSVLMLALGQWLLDPILLLRNNLLAAAKNPERPSIIHLKSQPRDEVGIAIKTANDLIQQNASNMLRLRLQAEDRIQQLAYFDTLMPDLPNRTKFMEELESEISVLGTPEGHSRIAVLVFDLDHFKDINDTMGHDFGDKVLKAVGDRLKNAAPDNSTVARLSADEFAIMAPIKEEGGDTARIVEKLFASLAQPVNIMHENFQIRASIGVARCPDDALDANQLIKNADIALNRAKEEGRGTVRYYSQDDDRRVQERFQMLRDLRDALDAQELDLHYHPQFDLRDGSLIGVESLLRWWKPDNSKEGGSFIPPIEFIPIAEQSGLIVPIGEWVMKLACEQNKKWQEMGIEPFRMAVNLSAVQFHRSDIVEFVSRTLEETGLEPHWLELEVTESVFMEDIGTTIDILNQLHRLGVELAVDDFGTGYSSLSYLRQFPIDRLKIDQSFTRNALVNPDDQAITRTIISLGHSLGLKVIAEGVETYEHQEFLKGEGCDEVQGFKYSRPIPKDELVKFIEEYKGDLCDSA